VPEFIYIRAIGHHAGICVVIMQQVGEFFICFIGLFCPFRL
jgi:hypothetical protein